MKYDELSKGFERALGSYPGDRTFGTSFYDQYRNARSGIGYLKDIDTNTLDDEAKAGYDKLLANAKGMKGSAIAGGVMAGVTGATQILTNAMQAGQIQDTTGIRNQLDDLSRVGSYGYNNFDELANEYANASISPDINYDDIRGMSAGQKVANVGSSALSGAAAGMQIGGPWGAAIGGVIGAGASLAGILSGNQKARIEENYLNSQARVSEASAMSNLEAAHENILDRNNRKGAINVVAKGGKIDRSQSITSYANKHFSKPRQKSYNCGGRITRTRGDGGVTIRIRIK